MKPLVPLRAVRIAMMFFILPIAVILLGGALLLYVFQGQEISSTSIDEQVQSTLQSVLGDEYEISIAETGLSFVSSSLISLRGTAITVSNRGMTEPFLIVDEVDVGLDPLSLLSGSPVFNRLVARGGKLISGQILSGSESAVPVDPKDRLHQLARVLSNAEVAMGDGGIKLLQLDDFAIETQILARREAKPIIIRNAIVTLDANNKITVTAEADTGVSEIKINAGWSGNGQGARQLAIGMGPISSLEWFPGVSAEDPDSSMGLETTLRIDARIPFDEHLQPLETILKIQADKGAIQLAPNSAMALGHGIFNLEIDPVTRSVVLAESSIGIENEKFLINGVLAPVDPANLTGDFNLDIRTILLDNPEAGSPPLGLTASFTGVLKPASSMIELDQVAFDTSEGSLAGTLSATFGATTPAVSSTMSSKQLSVRALQRIWPKPLAGFARWWVVNNLEGGTITDFRLVTDFPQGRILDVNEGLGFQPGELAISAGFSGAQITTFGEMPPVQGAAGDIVVDHAALGVNISSATVPVPVDQSSGASAAKPAQLKDIRIDIPNLFAWGAEAKSRFTLVSGLSNLAMITNAEPLRIAQRLAVKPSELKGDAEVDMVVNFPLDSTEMDEKLAWSADIVLKDGASKTKFFDHVFENADMTFKVDQQKVSGKGKAAIDGQPSDVEFTEPILGGPADLRQRRIITSLDHTQLAERGFSVSPVIRGAIRIEIVSQNGKPDTYTIDLTKAEVNLPWIYWSKGANIPAEASFSLTQKDGINTLSGFQFSGSANGGRKFGASGELSFNRNGLLGAQLKNVSLNENDLFDVNVSTAKGRYNIDVGGKAFDARAIIQQVIHTGQFTEDKSGTSVTLSANFGQLYGFNNQVMENAIVSYRTDEGRLSFLEIKGAANGQISTINAVRTGQSTRFEFYSRDAGSSLAFVNLYEKMRSGKLVASLEKVGNGPYVGDVTITKFTVENEERLASIVRAPVSERRLQKVSGKLQEIDIRSVRFDDMKADISKDSGSLSVQNGRIRNAQIGLTFEGLLYDAANQMNMRGTFMPLFTISRLLGEIPIIGDILSNGTNSGLIGITYRLKGAANDPAIAVNPISVIAPGIFREIFQFQE